MDYKNLKQIVDNYHLQEYISLLKGVTRYDKEFSRFYLIKRNIIWRLFSGFSLKYYVFQNYDYEYGRVRNEKNFKTKDEASNYLWELFVEYVNEDNDQELLNIISKIKQFIE